MKQLAILLTAALALSLPDSLAAQLPARCATIARELAGPLPGGSEPHHPAWAISLFQQLTHGGTHAPEQALALAKQHWDRDSAEVLRTVAAATAHGYSLSGSPDAAIALYRRLHGPPGPVLEALQHADWQAAAYAFEALQTPLPADAQDAILLYACDAGWRILTYAAAVHADSAFPRARVNMPDIAAAEDVLYAASVLLDGPQRDALLAITTYAFDTYGVVIKRATDVRPE